MDGAVDQQGSETTQEGPESRAHWHCPNNPWHMVRARVAVPFRLSTSDLICKTCGIEAVLGVPATVRQQECGDMDQPREPVQDIGPKERGDR
jgi:hypothetical protein